MKIYNLFRFVLTMALATVIGLTAAALTTSATLPQAFKSWKTKKTDDLSFLMYLALTVGALLWLVYGVLIDDLPIMLANAFTFIQVSLVLGLKVKYG